MSSTPLFLNCRIRAADGSPIEGLQVRSFLLAQPETVYAGRTNSRGEVQAWSRHGAGESKFWLCCPNGSDWRFIFDVPDHVFPTVSTDFHVSGHADANITLTIAPSTIALSNGSFEDIAERHNVRVPFEPDSGPSTTEARILGRRNSSSLGSISDISSFTLDSEPPPIRNMNSYHTPVYYSQSPVAVSESGDIAFERHPDSPTLGFSWDDWFNVHTRGEEEESDDEQCVPSRKRMHEEIDGGVDSDDDAATKRIKVSE